jgi:hypothetical protein
MPPKTAPKIPFTFGIELEFIFATDERAFNRNPTYLQPLVLSNTALLKSIQKQASTSTYVKAIDRVSRILQRSGLTVLPQLEPHMAGDYTQWQVTYDASVILRTTRLRKYDQVLDCAASIAKISNTKGWDSTGVELVSRVLSLPHARTDASFEEVKAYVDALHIKPELNDPWLAVGKLQSAGLHVHIGVASEKVVVNGIPLPVLQELGFLLAKYENLISLLHNPSRRLERNGARTSMLSSNLAGLRCVHGVHFTLDEIRDRIFAPGMTANKVAAMMSKSGRAKDDTISFYKFVNWVNHTDTAGKKFKTLEFRQHAGTLNAEEIEQWVWFLTRLVRTAEALAASKRTKESSSVRKTAASSRTRMQVLTELMQLIKLDANAKIYWRGRLCKESPKDAFLIMEEEVCLKCHPRKVAPIKKASPIRKAGPVKKVSPIKKAGSVKKVSPVKKASDIKKASPVKRISPMKKAAPTKTRPKKAEAVKVKVETKPAAPTKRKRAEAEVWSVKTETKRVRHT